MLHLREIVVGGDDTPLVGGVLTLTFENRRRSRQLARLDDGREVAVMLPRGTTLRDGDRVRASEGEEIFEVRAAAESLSVASTADPHRLAVAAYHLGNRHVPLQIASGWVAYPHDHVLDDLARGLGLEVETQLAPFEPESGAFRAHSHGHDGHAHHDHHHHA